jgi:hypothetical protein
MNDYCDRSAKFIAAGRPKSQYKSIGIVIRKFTDRIRIANERIDQIEAFFPRTS